MIGETISHYQILEKLGEGGMGVVYKATDTRLNRFVALKFLPAHVSEAEKDKERFVQEAQAAASLSHSNICTIYGIEEHEGKQFIVMEHVDGQTLQEKKQNLSLKQALGIGIQIADGLAAAHEKGIVHRDIKPENIMIRVDGTAQIMDFGLAKLRGASRLTRDGSTVGTVGYMSPEQVQGLEADHRSDIFSLGVILYELIAGRSPFKGVHETAIIYEIVNVEAPPISSVRPEIDPELERLVMECLAKEPQELAQSAAELARNLRRVKRDSDGARSIRPSASARTTGTSPASRQVIGSSWRRRHWIVLLLACALAALGSALILVSLTPEPDREVRKFTWRSEAQFVSISPDGKKIATMQNTRISIRRLSSTEPVDIDIPDSPSWLIWAPNSEDVAYQTGFVLDRELRRVSVDGHNQSLIARTGSNFWPRYWGMDDSIVVSTWDNTGQNTLLKVSASGGPLIEMYGGDTLLSRIHGDLSHVMELPDGKSILLSVNGTQSNHQSRIVLQTNGRRSDVYTTSSQASINAFAFANSGHILFPQHRFETSSGYDVWALPFDSTTLKKTGEPFLVIPKSNYVSVSTNGMIAYIDYSNLATGEELVFLSRSGQVGESIQQSPEPIYTPAFSPDGSRIAAVSGEIGGRTLDVWLFDPVKKTKSRLSSDVPMAWAPSWSPDGKEIIFTSGFYDDIDIYVQRRDGISPAERLIASDQAEGAARFSADGRYIIYSRWPQFGGNADIWYAKRSDPGASQPLFESKYWETSPCPSPDGRYIAYQSNKSGQDEIYVTRFPEADQHWQVSFNGGKFPQWIGSEIFFVDARTNELLSSRVSTRGGFDAALPEKLFSATVAGVSIEGNSFFSYAVGREGKRIVASRNLVGNTKPKTVIVENWYEEFREKQN
jgi:eukaryotic-like serine/threonine-protein kinase